MLQRDIPGQYPKIVPGPFAGVQLLLDYDSRLPLYTEADTVVSLDNGNSFARDVFLEVLNKLRNEYSSKTQLSKKEYKYFLARLASLIAYIPGHENMEMGTIEDLFTTVIDWARAFDEHEEMIEVDAPIKKGDDKAEAKASIKGDMDVKLISHPYYGVTREQEKEYETLDGDWFQEQPPCIQNFLYERGMPKQVIPTKIKNCPVIVNGRTDEEEIKIDGDEHYSVQYRYGTFSPNELESKDERTRLTRQNLAQFLSVPETTETKGISDELLTNDSRGCSPLVDVFTTFVQAWDIQPNKMNQPLPFFVLVQTIMTGVEGDVAQVIAAYSKKIKEAYRQGLSIDDTEKGVQWFTQYHSHALPIGIKDSKNKAQTYYVLPIVKHVNRPVNGGAWYGAIRTRIAQFGNSILSLFSSSSQSQSPVENAESVSRHEKNQDAFRQLVCSVGQFLAILFSRAEAKLSDQGANALNHLCVFNTVDSRVPAIKALIKEVQQNEAFKDYVDERYDILTEALKKATGKRQRRNILRQRTLIEALRIHDDVHTPLLFVVLEEYLNNRDSNWLGPLREAALELWVVEMLGLASGSCKSGKDRKGLLMLFQAALKAFYFKYHRLPPHADKPKDPLRQAFVQIFKALFLSKYAQMIAEKNAQGIEGLKNIEAVLKDDEDLCNAIKPYILFNKEIAHWNEVHLKAGYFLKAKKEMLLKLQAAHTTVLSNRQQSSANYASICNTLADPHVLADLCDSSNCKFTDRNIGGSIYQFDSSQLPKTSSYCQLPSSHMKTTFLVKSQQTQDNGELAVEMVKVHMKANKHLLDAKKTGKIYINGKPELVQAILVAFRSFAKVLGVPWDNKLRSRFQLPKGCHMIPAERVEQMSGIALNPSLLFVSKEAEKQCMELYKGAKSRASPVPD